MGQPRPVGSEGVIASRTESRGTDGWNRIIGSRTGLQQIVERARTLCGVDLPVLLEGETGVGKEVFARALHDGGPRRESPFIALNCGGLPRDLLASELFGYVEGAFTGAARSGRIGKVESARGGTLFLDEIAELPLDLQPYLLRVLETGEVCPLGSTEARRVKFRLVSACNTALRDRVIAGRFRLDLFYRISVTSIRIPPLRERLSDVPALVEHFAAEVAARHGVPPKTFSPEVLEVFSRHHWPGNVRELRNVVESTCLLAQGDMVGLSALPRDLVVDKPNPEFAITGIRATFRADLERIEREAIALAIDARAGNLTQAAKDLGMSRSTLYLKLKKLGLEALLNRARLSN